MARNLCIENDDEEGGNIEGSDDENEGSDGDGSSGDDEEESDDEHLHWNSEEGWKVVIEKMKKVQKALHNYGSICMICGERRSRNKTADPAFLDECAITDDVERYEFYPDFPKKEVNDRVCILDL